jgi:hypothetical protein
MDKTAEEIGLALDRVRFMVETATSDWAKGYWRQQEQTLLRLWITSTNGAGNVQSGNQVAV